MRKFFTEADPIVPTHHPRVLVETAVSLGADRAELLAGTGLDASAFGSPDARISYREYAALTENALRLTGDPGLGLLVGRSILVPQMGVLGLALMNSESIGEALELWLRHAPAIAPSWELSVHVEGELGFLRVREAISRRPFETFATDVLLSAMDTQGRMFLGRPLPVRSFRFAFPAPPHARRYRELYDVPVRFDEDVTEVAFDAELLSAKIPFADPASAAIAREYCASELPAALTEEGLIARMRNLLCAEPGPPPDVDQLARILQTSARTLRRNLHRMGTSYRDLLEESRRTRVHELARSDSVSVEDMATTLGFTDIRSFRRAFKRWTGHSPTGFRRRTA